MQFKPDKNIWGERYYTTELALNLFKSYNHRSIVQAGGQSRDFQYSPVDLFNVFGEFIEDVEKGSYSLHLDIDNTSKDRLDFINRSLYKYFDVNKIFVHKEINIKNKEDIGLLVLNDIYYPIKEIKKEINKLNNDLNILECLTYLQTFSEDSFMKRFGEFVLPSQQKVLEQYKSFRKNLRSNSIVLLEGNDYPGGSQTLLAKRQLESDGFICLLNLKQSVWLKR